MVNVNTGSLVMFGGGKLHVDGLEYFSKKTNGGSCLVITWPTKEESGLIKDLKSTFKRYNIFDVISSPSYDEIIKGRKIGDLLHDLNHVDSLFICGGDQGRMSSILSEYPVIKNTILDRYSNSGLTIAGTSAGTAIMSNPAITGNCKEGTVELIEGLGLLTSPFIVEQHYFKRHREGRFLELLRNNQIKDGSILIAVDEDSVVVIEDSRVVLIAGSKLTIIKVVSSGEVHFNFYNPGTYNEFKLPANANEFALTK